MKKIQFSHQYTLLKDTPKYKAGWKLGWSGNKERFYFYKKSNWGYDKGEPNIYLDYEDASFTIEEIQDKSWFEPKGKLYDYVPSFPTRQRIEDFMYLVPELRLVADVDESRTIGKMLDDKDFQNRLYEFYKKEYNNFYKN